MMRLLSSMIVVAGVIAAQASAQSLTFEQVIHRALDRSTERERARLATALATEHYLEAQSKFRWEFRPRVGLLTFSSPALLASNIGLGMLLGRTQPPAWARQSARLDSLAAEVAVERAAVTTRMEVSRQYFQVLLRQQAHSELLEAVRR